MPGTKSGGVKARDANYAKHGKDFYKRIGKMGGQSGRGPNYKGGFASDPELARRAGQKGGRISRRGPESEKSRQLREQRRIAAEQEQARAAKKSFLGRIFGR